jgi:hypothetical protein
MEKRVEKRSIDVFNAIVGELSWGVLGGCTLSGCMGL